MNTAICVNTYPHTYINIHACTHECSSDIHQYVHACTLHSYMYINSDTYTSQEIYIHAQKHTHILKYTHVTANHIQPQFYNQSISLHTHICIHTHMYICIYIHIYTDAYHTHIHVYPQPLICAYELIRTNICIHLQYIEAYNKFCLKNYDSGNIRPSSAL